MKILLISHDATRTGAPILLLNLADALSTDRRFSISFMLKRHNGDLIPDFEKRGPVYSPENKVSRLSRIPGVKRLIRPRRFSPATIKKALEGVDVVISNTITNGDLLPEIRRFYHGPVLSYIHELPMAAATFTNAQDIANLIASSDRYLTPCHAVKQFLCGKLGIAADKIDILPYYIPPADITPNKDATRPTFVIGGAGTADWRKGADLFVAVAKELTHIDNITFRWKGAIPGSQDLKRLEHDIELAGLNGKVGFLNASPDVDSFFAGIDLFLLTSREDPYPLVVLEAAGHGVPTVCFDRAGGAQEFVERDAGEIIPYLELNAMADAITRLFNDRESLRQKGEIAKEKVRQKHQHIEAIIAAVETAISKLTNTRTHS